MIKLFLRRWNALLPGLCCSVLLLSACATITRPEDTVKQRVTARWEALLSDDLAGAYEFLSPGFRSSVSSVQYQRSLLLKKIKWTGARYIESECEETTCKVKISLDYTLHAALPGVSSFSGSETTEESWIQSDNSWYLVPKR